MLSTKTDFDIDLKAETVTCPAGHTTEKYYRRRDDKGRRMRSYRFPAATCRGYPLRRCCTQSKRGRSVSLNYHERTLQEAYAYNQTSEFKQKYRRRALVERKLSELLQRHHLRYGRFIGTRKTRRQALWKAAVVNLKRLGKLLEEDLPVWWSGATADALRQLVDEPETAEEELFRNGDQNGLGMTIAKTPSELARTLLMRAGSVTGL